MNAHFLNGLVVLEPSVFSDDRGYFFESYNKVKLAKDGIAVDFIQDNESKSSKMTMRGLHWQDGKYAQSKLVRVVSGAMIDFVLDIRKSSLTFGKMAYFYLSGSNKRQLFIPRGFAHGFIALEDNTIFSYKVDNYYCKESERGVNLFSHSLNIISDIEKIASEHQYLNLDFSAVVVSDKDKAHPDASDILPKL